MYYNQDERGPGRSGVKVLALFFAAIVIAGTSFLAGTLMGPLKEAEPSGLEAQFPGITDIEDFEKLFEVRETLYQTYYKDIDDSVLIEGAIKGMVDSLGDPYTVFFNAEEYSAFNEEGTGNYVGIGIMVGAKDDKIVVITTFDGTPAYEAGIRSGDVIVRVEGVEYKGSQMDQAVSIIRGEAGQAVNLTIEREGTQMDLSVVRDHDKSWSTSRLRCLKAA
jgi:Periplasmic protease